MRSSELQKEINKHPLTRLAQLKDFKLTGRVQENKNGKVWRTHRVIKGVDHYKVWHNDRVIKRGVSNGKA